ncbi:MAG: glycosyl hydrolase [Cyclobacteriaceae bacterium]
MKPLVFLFTISLIVVSHFNAQAQLQADTFSELKYRQLGPFRGGRSTAAAGVPDDIFTYYMGATGGGVWKTTDGGTTWDNVSDGYFSVGSIGAIEVAPSDKNVVYVGTGSADPRGNISTGKGIYKSQDAGSSWQFIGLPNAGQISRLQIHPRNEEQVYAAVLGNIFGPSKERGIYRTLDGGKNWKQILFVNDSTGASDLIMDPNNPRILYAGFWQAERKPWTMIDGGKGSGVYKSTDGGDTWSRLSGKGGLPTGIIGKVGIAVSPVNSNRVWVIHEHIDETKGGLYLSEDGGQHWTRVNRDHLIRQRAWYYSKIFAHPTEEHSLFIVNVSLFKSTDDGRSIKNIPTPHGDHHYVWINPEHPDYLINCNDGGANVSFNGGKTWSTQWNQPTGEFYRVTVDNQFPYRVYGAQQDNTTISMPSRGGDIHPASGLYEVGGGESGHIAVDPRNPDIIYAGTYIGIISRIDRSKDSYKRVGAYPELYDGIEGRDLKYRFQWNAPIRFSPHDPNVLYITSNYVHRSTDEGHTWQVISPDLTNNIDKYLDIPGEPIQNDNTSVELYSTIFAFEESTLEKGVLWAGSDDGLVHISRDNGASWKNITPKGMPKEGTVNMIDLSSNQKGRAHIAVYKYRDNDFRPYVYQTNDYGKSWKLLTNGTNGIPADYFVRVVREDPAREGLLYAGTEFGMFISFDNGTKWQPFQQNLPITPVTDIAVHHKDLVVSTQGRAYWILDDLSPLHDWKPNGETQFLSPRLTYRTQISNGRGGFRPDPAPTGALLHYYLPKADTVEIIIHDANNNEVNRYEKIMGKSGINRFSWDLTYPKAKLVPGAFIYLSYSGGPKVIPGEYKVSLKAGDRSYEQILTIEADPRWEMDTAGFEEQLKLQLKVRDMVTDIHKYIASIRSLREQLNQMSRRVDQPALHQSIEDFVDKLTAVEDELIQTKTESHQDPINYPVRLDTQVGYLFSVAHSQEGRPNNAIYVRLKDLEEDWSEIRSRFDNLVSEVLPRIETSLNELNIPFIGIEN